LPEKLFIAIIAATSSILGGVLVKVAESLLHRESDRVDDASTVTEAAIGLVQQQNVEIERLQAQVCELTEQLENAKQSILAMRERLFDLERKLGKTRTIHANP